MVLCRGSRCGTDNDPVRITFGVSDSGALTSFLWQRLMLLPRPAVRVALLFAAGCLSAAILAVFGDSFNSIEERVGALGWTLFPDSALEERIFLVVIDEPSIAEIGPWPWSRDVMAQLVSAIDAAGAQLQLHDITYLSLGLAMRSFLCRCGKRMAL